MEKEEINQFNFEESRLISLLQEGSEYDFQLIYDKYRNRIYQTAINFLKSPIIAQDVVQDVFMKLWFGKYFCSQLNLLAKHEERLLFLFVLFHLSFYLSNDL